MPITDSTQYLLLLPLINVIFNFRYANENLVKREIQYVKMSSDLEPAH